MSVRHNIRDLINVPFLDKGRDFHVGLDCWGLVLEVSRRLGHELPDFARKESCQDALITQEQMQGELRSSRWKQVVTPEVGDLVAMALEPYWPDAVSHFGVYLGEDEFIHTLSGHNVALNQLSDMFYRNKIKGYFRWNG